ncbi:hypothetical protein CspeluHIS016_0211640 [Cutaneotrichosporon spelunceum]|uniref:Uncharacterized protein n=1 Tax=Cutaneotrichosporon spelunceum TaxID=1672016 RepID=A0AAD3YBH5_9TREE|nr:hypothetical protein CspeluHIS016_0211640 [Cutaneotrichosporon spelunceum]
MDLVPHALGGAFALSLENPSSTTTDTPPLADIHRHPRQRLSPPASRLRLRGPTLPSRPIDASASRGVAPPSSSILAPKSHTLSRRTCSQYLFLHQDCSATAWRCTWCETRLISHP